VHDHEKDIRQMSLNDGSANAPAGAPQLPNLLNNFAVLPPWEVAGVNYAVGVPAGTTLQDWETISQPGVSVDVATNTVTITGNNVTLNDIDFSLHGGAQLLIYGSNDVVSNSNFVYGTSMESDISLIAGSGSNVTIKNDTLNGNGPTLGSATANQTSLISGQFTGTTTVEYNLMENFNQHALEMNGSGALNYEYNLIENGGSGATGQHLNYLQFGSGVFGPVTVEFNTTYQPTTPISGGEGFQFYNNGSGSVNATLAYNTMIYGPNGEGRVHVPSGQYSGTTTASIHDNYISDPTGTFFYPDHNTTLDHYSGDINLATGASIDAPDAAGTSPGNPIPVTSSGGTTTSSGGTTTSSGGTTTSSGGTTTSSGGTTTSSGGTTTSTNDPPPLPTLSVANHSLSVTSHGGEVALGIGVTVPDPNDTVSVTISGLPKYETITDNLDHRTFSGTSVTLSAAQVNSGLILTSNYHGKGRPVAGLTVTATDSLGGRSVTTAPQTITVTDPPATSSSTSQSFALLNQYLASGFGNQTGHGHVTTESSVNHWHDESFLTRPGH
jgi:hypothetical protein